MLDSQSWPCNDEEARTGRPDRIAPRARRRHAAPARTKSTAGALAVAALVAALLGVPGSNAAFLATTGNTGSSLAADTLDPPTSFAATSGTSMSLDWAATVDTYAAGYRILRSATSGGPYTQIADLPGQGTINHIDSSAEGTYYYLARAYFGNWLSVDTAETSGRIWRAFDCPSDADLRLCVRFDTDVGGTYLDESGNSNTVTHTNGTLIDGISDKAADGVPTSQYEIADSASLDLTTAMTIEAWLRLDSLPGSGRAGVLDNDGQYSVILYAGTGLRCSNGVDDLPHEPVSTGVWFHMACAWDGSDLTLYIDGAPVQTMASVGTIDTTNTDPISILDSSPLFDEPMDGAIDNLRVWHSARTQAQICADAGITGC